MRYIYQLINREHHFVTALSFGMQRFVCPLQEQKDLISNSDHRTLFQNLDEVSSDRLLLVSWVNNNNHITAATDFRGHPRTIGAG